MLFDTLFRLFCATMFILTSAIAVWYLRHEQWAIVHNYLLQNRYSGLLRHYDTRAVKDNVKLDTHIRLTGIEARYLVNRVRLANGWKKADYL